MAYDEGLAHRVREMLEETPAIKEKKMFGGIAWMLEGNMACGVIGDRLMVRVGAEGYEAALAEAHVKEMDMTGRPMRGWVTVDPQGISEDEELQGWIERGLNYARSLPPK